MPKLLRIDSSPAGTGQSFSRELTQAFVQNWKEAYPEGTVTTRDLTATPLSPLNAEWIGAVHTPEAARTPRQHEVLALSDGLIAELESADEYVIGVSMHNFSIPGVLKLWIDQVVRAGRTFSYAGGAPAGLLKGKKATFVLASGGVYEPGTPMEPMNFAEPYLRAIFAFMGVTDVEFVRAGGTFSAKDKAGREAFLRPVRDLIRTHVQAA